jgi:aspartyl-tRNA(Asn)/glutamyl-tRNA(Gln) amidotransferase subunit A
LDAYEIGERRRIVKLSGCSRLDLLQNGRQRWLGKEAMPAGAGDGIMRVTLDGLAGALAEGRTTAAALVEESLGRIADGSGEGGRVFLKVHAEGARAAARAMDTLRAAGLAPTPYAGIPISVKDLFDEAGHVTTAGSRALADAAPATMDAPAIARLRAAGFVIVGRTNMTEFAFSGIGLNPHHGTPKSPWDRETGRIPGGSSSGAAVSVADGMAALGIGSDTGGSCRIPAAFCGTVGYKPTAESVPRAGVIPLSETLDSIGSMAADVAGCRVAHRVMAGLPLVALEPSPLGDVRIAVPRTLVFGGMDATVARAFERALARLSDAGATVVEIELAELADMPVINAKGGIATAEAYAWHRALLAENGKAYDPRVRTRLLRGADIDAADYIHLVKARAGFRRAVERATARFDLLAMPTVPIVAPAITPIEADEALFTASNMLVLRNPTVINMIDGCSISLPMHEAGEPPTGLMLSARHGEDEVLFRHAAAAERALLR